MSGAGCQVNGVEAPGVLLTLSILNSNNVPAPFNGTKVFMKADMRRIRTPVGGFGRMLAETFQFESLVSPALWTCGVAKVTTLESKVKSPWKPT